MNAAIAQLAAHHLAKVDVAGSSPVCRSKSILLTSSGNRPLKPEMPSSNLEGITNMCP